MVRIVVSATAKVLTKCTVVVLYIYKQRSVQNQVYQTTNNFNYSLSKLHNIKFT